MAHHTSARYTSTANVESSSTFKAFCSSTTASFVDSSVEAASTEASFSEFSESDGVWFDGGVHLTRCVLGVDDVELGTGL